MAVSLGGRADAPAAGAAACLEALAPQNIPPERFEVIVVVDDEPNRSRRPLGTSVAEPAADPLEGVSDDNDRQVGSRYLSECPCYPVMRVS